MPIPLTPRVLLGSAVFLCSLSATAYVPGRTTKSGIPIHWKGSNCVFIRVNATGSGDISDGSDVAAAKRALENWRQATASCSHLRFNLLPDSTDAKPGFDEHGENECVIAWEEASWPPKDSQAAAITTVYHIDTKGSLSDGQILDADIVLNGVNFKFTTSGANDLTDVENTVTHELGHLMGLDHTCYDDAEEPLYDHTGAKVPYCYPVPKIPQIVRDTTMFTFADPGETKKRSVEADDALGICSTYPLADDPGVCAKPEKITSTRGCSVVAAGEVQPPPAPAWVLPLLALLLLAFRRRR